MQGQTVGARPSRAQIDMAALELVRRYGASIVSMARRYSVCAEDAEDAYQRGLEILLTKAPSARHEELVPWLRTVVKHEAFEIRRQRLRAVPTDKEVGLMDETAQEPPAEIHAQRLEKLRLGAEAMSRLKPPEIRCLLLKAEGYSYDEICSQTGFSFTKVNRSLSEGRRSFKRGLASIESGAECERLAPLLSRLADGEASPDEVAELRPHLRGCPACRATLREYRTVPARMSALPPPLAAEPVSRLGELLAAAKAYLAGMFGSALQGGAGATVGKAAAIVAIGGAAFGGAAIESPEPEVASRPAPPAIEARTDPRAVATQPATLGRPLRPAAVAREPQQGGVASPRRESARPAPRGAPAAESTETFGFEQSKPETTSAERESARPPAAAPAAEPEAEFSFER